LDWASNENNPQTGQSSSNDASPVDCVWGSYSEWSSCSKTCGGGERTRTRNETTPASNGGRECEGDSTETENCNQEECPLEQCPESTDLMEQFVVMSGTEWELTKKWDCGGGDIGGPMYVNQNPDKQAACAQKCSEDENCVAFNYAYSGSKCHFKCCSQMSTRLGKTCGQAGTGYMYYTLLRRNATC